MLKGWLTSLAEEAFLLNQRNIVDLLKPGPYKTLCDLGCDDGGWTQALAQAVGFERVYGVEIMRERARLARGRGIDPVVGDLSQPLPFADEAFSVVHANQVIEHVGDIDRFLSEVHRILHPGGIALISTENGSSWHNVFAAALGWQIFSLTNVSPRSGGVGNPFALHRDAADGRTSWTHKTIFNFRGLIEVVRPYGLDPLAIRGAGYHPLPPTLGRLDPRHAHVLALKAVKL